jgi:hypothetical protein
MVGLLGSGHQVLVQKILQVVEIADSWLFLREFIQGLGGLLEGDFRLGRLFGLEKRPRYVSMGHRGCSDRPRSIVLISALQKGKK